MQLNTIAPAPGSHKAKKRVGRGIGSGSGKTCGSGHKGQKSRTGGTVKPGFEGGQMPLQMRLPKFGFNSRLSRITAEIRSAELNKVDGDVVNLDSLRKAGLIAANIKRVKVMLSGEVTRKLTVEDVRVSKGARAAIEKAGGKVVEAAESKSAKPAPKGKGKAKAKAKAAPAEAPAADESPSAEGNDEGNDE